jgi:hypothetical protein
MIFRKEKNVLLKWKASLAVSGRHVPQLMVADVSWANRE